jgi:hypothetical protein
MGKPRENDGNAMDNETCGFKTRGHDRKSNEE